YRMLETVRQYARDRLLESGEAAVWRDRHLDYFLERVEQAQPYLSGPEQQAWLERLDLDHDNILSALEWSLSRPDANTSLRLGSCLYHYWLVRAHLSEGRRWLKRILEAPGALSPSKDRANALNGAGMLAGF